MSELNYEQRMRLKFNQYAYSTAYKRLKQAIENNNNHEIYSAIGELLLWVMTTHEWYKFHYKESYLNRVRESEEGIQLFGLVHAYNSMKHNMKLFVIHNKHSEFSFEIMDFSNFDFRPFSIRWVNACNLLDEGRENQMQNYINYIEGKEVIDVFDDVLIFLNNENHKLYFN